MTLSVCFLDDVTWALDCLLEFIIMYFKSVS